MDPKGYVRLEKNVPAVTPTSGEKLLRLDSSEVPELVDDDRTSLKIAAVTEYADQTAANAALAANVLYYNTATGLFQITTA